MTQPIVLDQTRSNLEILELLKIATNSQRPGQALNSAVNILRESKELYSWVGIYLVNGDNLVLGAYAGNGETQHVRIRIGEGICGLAARTAQSIIVPDVNKDPRYLMCFPSTRSEIVVPIKNGSMVLGEIDIDSDQLSAFTEDDQGQLEQAATILAGYLEKQTLSSVLKSIT